MAERVRITDVSPRDGLQNEPGVIPTAEKVRLVELVAQTGVDEVEVSSFVPARWVPQLGDARDVFSALRKLDKRSMEFSALVPNLKGFEAALGVNEEAGTGLIDKVAVFTAASETFSQRNTNATIAETIERFREVVERNWHSSRPVGVRAYISCAIACPFEGPIDPERVAEVAESLATAILPDEIDLGDTIGAGTPATVKAMLAAVQRRLRKLGGKGQVGLTLHLHDTFGRAGECLRVALGMGVRSFDGSVAGLGGCPYASKPGKRAPGNVSTELLVRTVHEAGYETGVDLDRLAVAAEYARSIVSKARAQAAGGGA